MPRRLSPDEKALWGKVMATVKPLHGAKAVADRTDSKTVDYKTPSPQRKRGSQVGHRKPALDASFRWHGEQKAAPDNLDSHWDRRIKRAGLVPDMSIDLHDSSLSRAYSRLDGALEQAVAQKIKVILLITGKPRAHDRASGEGRGAIAAVVRDWLAASRHARHISAVRNAHPRHGGEGALYIVLKG